MQTDAEVDERREKFWSGNSETGPFWGTEIKRLKDNPEKRLALAIENLPMPGAFMHAATAIRAMIKDNKKNNLPYADKVKNLYHLAVIHSLGYPLLERIPGKLVANQPYNYKEIGYAELDLIGNHDVKMFIELWGQPDTHSTLYEKHKKKWKFYEDKIHKEEEELEAKSDKMWKKIASKLNEEQKKIYLDHLSSMLSKIISGGISNSKLDEILRNENPSQTEPKGYYVYGHYDVQDNFFYIGKGTKKRAWSKERQSYWLDYVNNKLNDKYFVKIFIDNLTSEDAEQFETALMGKYSKNLINWVNWHIKDNYENAEKRGRLRAENRRLIEKSKKMEYYNLDLAIENYKQAIENISEYAFLQTIDESNYHGKLIAEENAKHGFSGETDALVRLASCLIKKGRISEAAEYTKTYFDKYKRDLSKPSAQKIRKRVEKALEKSTKNKK